MTTSDKPRYIDLPNTTIIRKPNTPKEIAKVKQLIVDQNTPTDAAEIMDHLFAPTRSNLKEKQQ